MQVLIKVKSLVALVTSIKCLTFMTIFCTIFAAFWSILEIHSFFTSWFITTAIFQNTFFTKLSFRMIKSVHRAQGAFTIDIDFVRLCALLAWVRTIAYVAIGETFLTSFKVRWHKCAWWTPASSHLTAKRGSFITAVTGLAILALVAVPRTLLAAASLEICSFRALLFCCDENHAEK